MKSVKCATSAEMCCTPRSIQLGAPLRMEDAAYAANTASHHRTGALLAPRLRPGSLKQLRGGR